MAKQPLSDSEWHFDQVPEAEHRWCLAWEIMRERHGRRVVKWPGGRPRHPGVVRDFFDIHNHPEFLTCWPHPWLAIDTSLRAKVVHHLSAEYDPVRDVAHTLYQDKPPSFHFTVTFDQDYNRWATIDGFRKQLLAWEHEYRVGAPKRREGYLPRLSWLACYRLRNAGFDFEALKRMVPRPWCVQFPPPPKGADAREREIHQAKVRSRWRTAVARGKRLIAPRTPPYLSAPPPEPPVKVKSDHICACGAEADVWCYPKKKFTCRKCAR